MEIPEKRKKLSLFMMMCCFPLAINTVPQTDKGLDEKSTETPLLLKNDQIVKKLHVVFGADPQGQKQKEEDGRTPEGNYTLDSKNSHSIFCRSIHISYLSKHNREYARNAHVNSDGVIIIHSQMNGLEGLSFISQYFNYTDDCISVTSKEIDQIWKVVDLRTLIEINLI